LATIAFISLQWFSKNARDSARISDLKTLQTWLELTRTKWNQVPLPEWNLVTIYSWSTIISKQWYMWKQSAWEIWVNWELKDPLDKVYYTYSTNENQTQYQLLAMLENNPNQTVYNNTNINILNQANASLDYSSRYSYTKWNLIGIFLDNIKLPLEHTLSWVLDLTIPPQSTTTYTVVISNEWIITDEWADLPVQIETVIDNWWVVAWNNPPSGVICMDMTDTEVNTLNTLYVNEDIDIYEDFDQNIWYDPSVQTSLSKNEWCNSVKSFYNYAWYLPLEIFNLVNLQGLYLANNQLSSIPAEIWNLVNLQVLSLDDNQLTSIPAEIWNLVNLQTLYLDYNQLTSIPAEIWNLVNLKYLYLNNNTFLWNLSTSFHKNSPSTSQSNITPDWKTVTIAWNGTTIDITVTP